MAMHALDYRNVNSVWAGVLAETLVRSGVRQAVISPGSRSTPLTFALAAHPAIEAVPVLDERSAAFFALGLARQQGRPVALLCTSGTAGANYFPAVIEAQESGVPLVVLTADRPPEMRDCGSGQTIDQQKLFGGHVNFFHELAVPEPDFAMLAYLRQTVAHAVQCSRSPGPGPVHLNLPLRDPLPPIPDGRTRELEGRIGEEFFAHLSAPVPEQNRRVSWPALAAARGVIIAGPAAPADAAAYAATVGRIADALGWPVLADALSPLRSFGAGAATLVSAYDSLLRNERLSRELAPTHVLCLGGWPTSKILRAWIEAADPEVLMLTPSIANRDALHGKTRPIAGWPEDLGVPPSGGAGPGLCDAWRRAEAAARKWIDDAMAAEGARFEGKAAWLLARSLPRGTSLFVANSMPVRDLEYFWPAADRGVIVGCNRGANGIDGTLSTALGFSHGRRGVLLTGDLALLHDANGFLSRPKFRGSLTIVLINNRGGGIFEHLAVAGFEPPFEEFVATPQQVSFATLCAAHGVEHVAVSDWAQFTSLVSTLPPAGIRVLELRTDRKRDAAIRKAWFAAAATAVA